MTRQSEFYKEILDHLTDGVYFVDRARRITYWNMGAERITGYRSEKVIGNSCADGLLMHVNDAGVVLCTNGCPLAKTILDGEIRESQVYLHHAYGHRVPVLIRAAPLRNGKGEIIGAIETFSDNSSLVAALKRVQELGEVAVQDALTRVGNRRYIELKLETCLMECLQHQLSAGILFIDVDHFKMVNDTYGHEAGDMVLKMVANTLRHNIRTTDFIGRWGGEEFLVILLGIDQIHLERVANKLRNLVANSHLIVENQDIHVTVSMGATLIHPDDSTSKLIQRADQLMYQSKAAGRNRVSFESL